MNICRKIGDCRKENSFILLHLFYCIVGPLSCLSIEITI
uniref:Uncharacterized protein n=1 Tax=Anguilla anguilla TaxID=7936 RepID=A0A0E9P786_ANGAN